MARPADHVVRLGLIRVSVWNRSSRTGQRFVIKLVRLYKDQTWRESTRLDQRDLLVAAKALELAYEWIDECTESSLD